MSSSATGFRALLVGLALAAFAVRAYEPLSRPHLWSIRSQRFASAVASGDWRRTYQRYHPAVTTMAVGALMLSAREAAEGSAWEGLFRWAVPSQATRLGREVAAGVLGLAVVEVLLLVAIVLVCRRLAGAGFALAAGGLLAFSPPVLAENRGFHPDALLGLLMMLSALLLLLALHERRLRLVAASGAVGGLALLTKTPSLFLFPYTALSLLVFSWPELRGSWAGPAAGRWRRLALVGRRSMMTPAIVWGLASATPFAAWPAMWADPLMVLRGLHYGVRTAALEPHQKMMFFLGELYPGTAPPLFYPVVLAFCSTFVTLTLAVAAVPFYAAHRKQEPSTPPPVVFWMIVAYVLFFTLQMALSSKQVGSRYVHPAQVGLEIVAAAGLAALAAQVRRRLRHPGRAGFAGAGLILLGVGLQAATALPYAPDYGAHHNQLLGGNPVAVRIIPLANRIEGLISLTRELRRLPDVQSATIASSGDETQALQQYFDGPVTNGISPEVDYYLFDRASLQRYMNPQNWEAAWQEARARRPAIVVVIDRVEFLWLYRARGEPGETIEIRRGWEGMGIVPSAWAATVAALLAWALWPLSWSRFPPSRAAQPGEMHGA